MKKWFKPEIMNLGLSSTAGNPNAGGNDNLIDDCLESAFEAVAGDTSGPQPGFKPNYSL